MRSPAPPRSARVILASLALTATACAARAAPPPTPARAPARPPPAVAPTDGPHAFTVDDMLGMDRLSSPAVSPDGARVAFTVSTTDFAANKRRTDVWLAATDGSLVRRLTSHEASDHSPVFAPDGRSIYFLSTRSGSSQVWRIAIDGGEATQVTTLPVDVDGVLPFPDGKGLLLSMEVFPDAATLADSAKRDEAAAKSPAKVQAFDQLPVRHWDRWHDGKRNHLFVVREGAPPVDLLKGLHHDAPTRPFGGMDEVAISPDGRSVVFTSKMLGREQMWSTNSDLWVVPSDGSARPASLTSGNPAQDTNPAFSPDGTKLAYLAMSRPGYESDKQRVMVMDWGTRRATSITDAWDRSPAELAWSQDGRSLLVSADHLGHHAVFALTLDGRAVPLAERGNNTEVRAAGGRVLWLHDSLKGPGELWTASLDGTGARAVTHVNDARVAKVAWGEPEQFSFTGAKGDKVYAFLIRPARMRPGEKVPVAFLIHGGPQGSFGDHFHYRWNPQAYAGHGYATIMVDFHGSTGYGQAFTDAIRGDWGGAPYEDLMKGLDFALAKYPELDKDRLTALGASYGGYMINWVNGKTDRFKALVCHDGNLDETMAYFDTEELWFPEWEHGGPPWQNPEAYARHSPMSLVKNWKTPTLVVHGGRDFRVVDTQGMGTFTALQRLGVPSRFVHFPDENHWVLKPQNSKRWHEEVLGWLDRFTAKK